MLNDPELVRKTRSNAIRDAVIFNLKTNKITFDEEKIRETLNKIDDELSLKNIATFSARLGNVELEDILREYDSKYIGKE